MNKALIVIYSLTFINLLATAHLHGKEKEIKCYNFWLTLISTIGELVLIWWALGWKFI